MTRADYQYSGNASGTATAKDGFTLSFNEPYYGLATCPDPCAGYVIENRPDYSMNYNGVELQVVKRLSHGWSLQAGVGYNDWTQTVGPGAIVNPNNLRGGVNVSGPVVEPAGKFLGNSGSYINSTWQFNVSGTVQLPLAITAAANVFGRQGFPTVYFVNAITRDSQDRDTIPLQIGSVGAYRNPDVYQLDLHVERPFRIGSRVTVVPALDCFNVANSHTVLQRVGFVGTYETPPEKPHRSRRRTSFNDPAEQLSNRTFRVGVRISFRRAARGAIQPRETPRSRQGPRRGPIASVTSRNPRVEGSAIPASWASRDHSSAVPNSRPTRRPQPELRPAFEDPHGELAAAPQLAIELDRRRPNGDRGCARGPAHTVRRAGMFPARYGTTRTSRTSGSRRSRQAPLVDRREDRIKHLQKARMLLDEIDEADRIERQRAVANLPDQSHDLRSSST